MKLKFRADAKDIIIFLIFCVVLLYFVAVAVLNLHQFSIDSTFHGINPIKAFSSEFIGATLGFFLLALIMIITNVSSYFFDMDDGIGFIPSKKEKKDGYSRWAKDDEIKKDLFKVSPTDETAEHAGIVLINNGKQMWVDDGEYHNLVIGSTGSGKTTLVVFPMVKVLAKKGESMIITDPKGEIYAKTATMLREKGYKTVVLNFRDPQKGSAWNPLMLPYQLYKEGNRDKALELLDDLSINILYSEKTDDPFWEQTAANYFVGLALSLFEDAREDQININSVNYMSTVGEERFRASTYLKEYFKHKDSSGAAYNNVSSALFAPTETKGSILSVFKSKVKIFSTGEKISEMLSHNDINMKEIGMEKTAVFLVIQDEKKTLHPLVTNFIKQTYETLIDVAQEQEGGKLKYRTNFILDEFANMPPLKDVTTMVTAARSRNMRFTFIIQNFSQLYQVYGKENGETIKGNCGNILYLVSTELSALEEISKLAGEQKPKDAGKDKPKEAPKPLITVSDLQRLSPGEVILLRSRKNPFKTKLKPDFEMKWGEEHELAELPVREPKKFSLFNIKEYVDELNDKKMKELMGSSDAKKDSVSSELGERRPFPGRAQPQPKPKDDVDIDELVKKIDAKIAELEEEEKAETEKQKKIKEEQEKVQRKEMEEKRKEQEALENKVKDKREFDNTKFKPLKEIDNSEKEVVGKPIDSLSEESISKKPKSTKDFSKEKEKNKVEEPVKKEEPEEKDSGITDDQFFDDFFGD